MRKIPQLFGVNLPQTSLFQLKEKIRKLNRNLSQKHVLYFHYSEFLLRANRNPWYKEVLNRGNLSAIDGKGLHWAMWSVMREGLLPKLYKSFFIFFPIFVRVPVFVLLFFIQLPINLVAGFLTLTLKYSFTPRTKNQIVLGRDFVYDLLRIADEKNFKTMIIGGSEEGSEVTQKLIQNMYPKLDLTVWARSHNSLLMQDKVLPEFIGETITSENVCQFFPDLWEAKKAIKTHKPDLVLVCLGGSTGRQEFFIDNIYQDPEMEFLLATGLGAAFDHMGGGAKQTIAPKWMISSGLEWLHRMIHQPYRRKRVFDSIVTLWWWTTVQQFMQNTQSRQTVVNILTNSEKQVLLVKRRNVLPGDVGWTFVQGGIEHGELTEAAGIREIVEEVKLEKNLLQSCLPSEFSDNEPHTVSFLRFLVMGAKYDTSKNFLNFVTYSGNTTPTVNWENMEARWFDHRDVMGTLSVEKRKDWTKAIQIIKNFEEQ